MLTTEKETLVFLPAFPADREEKGTASTLSKREKRRSEGVTVSGKGIPHRDLDDEEAMLTLMGLTPVVRNKVLTKASRTEG